MVSPARSGRGAVRAYWCRIGGSGRVTPAILSDEPSPYSGGAHHESGINSPTGRSDCGHPAVYNVDALDGRVAIEGGASGLLSAAPHFGGQVPCAGVAVTRECTSRRRFCRREGGPFRGSRRGRAGRSRRPTLSPRRLFASGPRSVPASTRPQGRRLRYHRGSPSSRIEALK